MLGRSQRRRLAPSHRRLVPAPRAPIHRGRPAQRAAEAQAPEGEEARAWSDIDSGQGEDGGRLHVRRSVIQGVVDTPKTEDSDRQVDIPQRVLDGLEVFKLAHPPIGDDGSSFGRPAGARLTATLGTTASWCRSSGGRPLPAQHGTALPTAHLRQPAHQPG